MVPVWVWIFLLLWVLVTFYLFWRLLKCKCSMVEKFESKKSKSTENAEEEDTLEKGKLVIAGKEESVTEEGYEEHSVKENDKDKKDNHDSKEKNKEADKEKPKDTGKKSIKESLLNYGEMKIFEGLRDNNYSLTDIKRMIREGEINEKMIEKFLARIEAMENKHYQKKTAEKEDKVEGFTGKSYASAVFQ